MVSPEVAVILRIRKSRNVFVHSRGISSHDIQVASRQVVQVLGNFAATKGRAAYNGSGDVAPSFTSDGFVVNSGRHIAMYKLINTVFVIVLAPAHANPFYCSYLLDNTVKLLCALNRSLTLTMDRVMEHYPEIALGVAQLVDRIGTNPSAAIKSASESLRKLSGVREKVPLLLARSMGSQPGPESPGSSGAQAAADSAAAGQKLSARSGQRCRMVFALPSEFGRYKGRTSRRPLQAANKVIQKETKPPDTKGATPSFDLSDFQSATVPATAASSASAPKERDLDLDDLFKSSTAPAPDPVSRSKEDAKDATAVVTAAAASAAAVHQRNISEVSFADFSAQPPPPAAGTLPLALVEVWRAEVEGSAVKKAGVIGEVQLSAPLPSGQETKGFLRLVPSAERKSGGGEWVHMLAAAHSCLLGSCRLAAVNPPDAPGLLEVSLPPSVSMREALMQYHLPAGSLAPPLLVRLTVAVRKEGAGRSLLVARLQYALGPGLPPGPHSLVIDAKVPPHLPGPLKVQPVSSYWAAQRTLRWQLPGLESGSAGEVKASFQLDPNALGFSSLTHPASGLQARLLLTSPAGCGTLSGTTLHCSTTSPQQLQPVLACGRFAAEVLVTADTSPPPTAAAASSTPSAHLMPAGAVPAAAAAAAEDSPVPAAAAGAVPP